MRWRDLRLAGKVFSGIGSVVLLLAATGTWAVFGIARITRDGVEASEGNKLRGELLQREVDHLKWSQALGGFVHAEALRELDIELDPTRCGFGKWYYGEGSRYAESVLGDLADPLRKIEEPHRRLHECSPWFVGIQHPRQEDRVIGSVAVVGQTVVTSGDYQRYFVDGLGKRHPSYPGSSDRAPC